MYCVFECFQSYCFCIFVSCNLCEIGILVLSIDLDSKLPFHCKRCWSFLEFSNRIYYVILRALIYRFREFRVQSDFWFNNIAIGTVGYPIFCDDIPATSDTKIIRWPLCAVTDYALCSQLPACINRYYFYIFDFSAFYGLLVLFCVYSVIPY